MEMEAAAPTPRPPQCRLRGGVRVVGRVRRCPDPDPHADATARFQVAVHRPSNSNAALLSFTHPSTPVPRKDICKLDWCYDKDDSTADIFSKEVKPLVHGLFQGSNACVVAYGACTSGKTHLIRGSEEDPGLLTMAMSQILELTEEIGGSVRISLYEVRHDNHIFDMLEPKEQEVVVLEDAERRTRLKGLSQVVVRSTEEFVELYFRSCKQEKHPTKAVNEQPVRGHQGLIAYLSKLDEHGKECPIAKMCFVDLAGYEDAKHRNNGKLTPANGSNANKSLYALMNVIHALNSNESFVPYRENKLTRILQDSLCKTSGAVLIACLDDLSCLDAINALNLASRSSQVVNEQRYSLPTNAKSFSRSNPGVSMSARSSSRSILLSIHRLDAVVEKNEQSQLAASSSIKAIRTPSMYTKRPHPTASSTKKPGNSISSSIKMKRDAKLTMSGRKLFSPSNHSLKEDASLVASTMETLTEKVQSTLVKKIEALSTDERCDVAENTADAVSCSVQEVVHGSMEVDCLTSNLHTSNSIIDTGEIGSANVPDNLVEKTPVSSTQSSPKLSDKLKEISNSLKLLSARPISTTSQKTDMPCIRQISTDSVEPKTPGVHLKFEHDGDPQGALKTRSTGIKKSLAQECLTFINSANKEQLKRLKGIGEKRANYILQLREESPEPFKDLDDLREFIGLTAKEIKNMMLGIIEDA